MHDPNEHDCGEVEETPEVDLTFPEDKIGGDFDE